MPKYTHRQQLISTQTIADIAEQVVNSKRQSKILRKYLFCRYNPLTNIFSNLVPDVREITWSGTAVEMSNIWKQDIDFVINVPQPDDPLTGTNENLNLGGAGKGMTTQTDVNTRQTDTIYIHALTTLIRLQTGGELVEHNAHTLIDRSFCRIRYAWVLWRSEDDAVFGDPTHKPDPTSLLEWQPFGFSRLLDTAIDAEANSSKIRVLASGETTMNVKTTTDITEKTIRLNKNLKNPILIQYEPEDQNGQNPTNWKLYFVIRSDVPDTLANSFFNVYPRAQICAKVHFSEP